MCGGAGALLCTSVLLEVVNICGVTNNWGEVVEPHLLHSIRESKSEGWELDLNEGAFRPITIKSEHIKAAGVL